VKKKWRAFEKHMKGVMVTRCGGFSIAASHWTAPGYESPAMPTLPFTYGSDATHSTVSYPSSPSWWYGRKTPSEA
jgi:hypothetical protein